MDTNTFKPRSGTIDKGKEFESINIANLILKLLSNSDYENFEISSNVENFGAFDDIVLELELRDGSQQKFAIQLKHSNSEKVLALKNLKGSNGDFSIQKYFDSIAAIDEYELVLSTNRKFNISGNERFYLENCNFLINIVERELNHLLNTDEKGRCFQFEVIDDINNGTNAILYKKFFERFTLYTNQSNFSAVKRQATQQFQEIFSCSLEDFEKYFRFINEWSGINRKKYKLNRNYITKAIIIHLLSPHIQAICPSSDCQKSDLLQTAISKFDVTLFEPPVTEQVTKMWNFLESEDEDMIKLAHKYQLNTQNIDNLTKTKIFWIIEKCPLIVTENPVTSSTVHFFNNQKFILLTNHKTERNLNSKIFQNLKDLESEPEIYTSVLEQLKCSIQGKVPVNLKFLKEQHEQFLDAITTNELILMLDNALIIGGEKETLPVPHIDRILSSPIIDERFLTDSDNKTLIIISHLRRDPSFKKRFSHFNLIDIEEYLHSEIYTYDDGDNSFQKNIYISDEKCSIEDFEIVCRRNQMFEPCHYFKITNKGTLQWIRSKGSIESLKKYQSIDFFIDRYNFEEMNKINIICADPGMGKSTFIKDLKNNLSSEFWTIILTATEISSYFCVTHHTEDKFLDFYTRHKYSTFELKILEIFKTKRSVIYIWDGLDEISVTHLRKVVTIIDSLSAQGFKQWITSRNHLIDYLQKKFQVFPKTISRFDEKQQEKYITDRLQEKCSNDQIPAIIKKIRNNVDIIHYDDVLAIPLQIYMLTELFRQNHEHYLALLDNLFSITDLYRHFVNEKFNIFYNEKAKIKQGNNCIERILEEHKNSYIDKYEEAALQILFEQNIFGTDCQNFLNKIRKKGDPFGLIIDVSDNTLPNFLHTSYGEYFAALYCFKNHKRIKIKDFLFEERYNNVRFLFDLLMATDCPAHVAVLYRNMEALKKYEDKVVVLDVGGRNPLQVACSWGQKYPLLDPKHEGQTVIVNDDLGKMVQEENREYTEIVEYLLDRCSYTHSDVTFGMTTLSYADKTFSLFPLVLISKRHKIDFAELINFKDIHTVLYYAIKFDYNHLLDILEDEVQFIEVKSDNSILLQTAVRYSRTKCVEKLLLNPKQKDAIDYWNKFYNTACDNGDIEIFELLAARKAIIKDSLLINAARKGHEAMVQLLLSKHKLNVNIKTDTGNTALHEACINGHENVVDLLIKSGVEINECNVNGTTALHFSAERGYLQIVNLLTRDGANIDALDRDKFSPLHKACIMGKEEIVSFLISLNANPNTVTVQGNTPLYSACQRGYKNIVKILMDHDADINMANNKGLTPLYIAYINKHIDIVKMLITNFDTSRVRKNQSLIARACKKNDYKMVQLLIDVGVDINQIQGNGCTLMYNVCKDGTDESIVKLLIQRGIDINGTTTTQGDLPIHVASRKGHIHIIKLLIVSKVDVNVQSRSGLTPLYIACQRNHIQVAKLLIESGADVNFVHKNGSTPLHIASEVNLEIVELLVKSGAKVNCSRKDGLTPIEIAAKSKKTDIVVFLKKTPQVNKSK